MADLALTVLAGRDRARLDWVRSRISVTTSHPGIMRTGVHARLHRTRPVRPSDPSPTPRLIFGRPGPRGTSTRRVKPRVQMLTATYRTGPSRGTLTRQQRLLCRSHWASAMIQVLGPADGREVRASPMVRMQVSFFFLDEGLMSCKGPKGGCSGCILRTGPKIRDETRRDESLEMQCGKAGI